MDGETKDEEIDRLRKERDYYKLRCRLATGILIDFQSYYPFGINKELDSLIGRIQDHFKITKDVK